MDTLIKELLEPLLEAGRASSEKEGELAFARAATLISDRIRAMSEDEQSELLTTVRGFAPSDTKLPDSPNDSDVGDWNPLRTLRGIVIRALGVKRTTAAEEELLRKAKEEMANRNGRVEEYNDLKPREVSETDSPFRR